MSTLVHQSFTMQERLVYCTEELAAYLSAELQSKQTQSYVTPSWPGHSQQDSSSIWTRLGLRTDCDAVHLITSSLPLSLS